MPTAEELKKRFGIGTTTPAAITPAAPKVDPLQQTAADLRRRFIDPLTPKATGTPSVLDTSRVQADQRVKDIESRTSPFLKTVFETARTYIGAGTSAIDRFAGDRGRDVKEFAEGKFKISPDDVLSGLGTTGMGALKITGALAQGFNEGIFRIAKSGAEGLAGGEERLAGSPLGRLGRLIPSSLQESITGRKPEEIDSYQKIFGAADQWATEKGATANEAKTFAGVAVLGSLFIDNPFVGPGKAAVVLSKEGLERVAKEGSEDVIKEVIKAENKDLSDEVIDFIAPSLVRSQTAKEVENAIRLVNNAAFTASRKVATRDSAERVAESMSAPARATDTLTPLTRVATTYPDEAAFARALESGEIRAKLADDILQAQKKAEDGSAKPPLTMREAERMSDEILEAFRTRPRAAADRPAIEAEARRLFEEGRKVGQFGKKTFEEVRPRLERQAEARMAVESVKGAKQEASSGAVEFYRQIKEGSGSPQPAARPSGEYVPNVNLVREIGSTKDKFVILQRLEKEFPTLTNRMLDRFVNKLAKLKRGSDIEGILKTAGKLDRGIKGKIAAGQKTLDRTMPKSIQKVLSNTEKYAYIANIKAKVQTPEQAVLAKHEYDMVWEAADQKVIDRYNDMETELSILEDVLSQDQAGTLYKKYYRGRDPADPSMELDELANSAMKRAKERRQWNRGFGRKPKPLTKREEQLLDVHAEVEALGFQDLDDAWNAIQRYARMNADVKELRAEQKALKPYVKSAQILRASLDQLPVVSNESVATIDSLARVNDVLGTYKDISGFSKEARDVYRNFKKFFGTRYEEAKKAILDPFDDAKGEFVDEVRKLGDELEGGITKRFGWSRGSKESEWIQRYGDTGLPAGERRNYDDLVKEFGREKADNIVEADAWFRSRYNRLIGELNEVRKRVYPNNPAMLIPFRKDYYRHFKEVGDGFSDAIRNLFDTPAGIDPKLAGISEYTKPKTRFLPFAQTRKGELTNIDAVGGFVDYMPMLAYAKHIDPQIGTFRYLHRKLGEVAPKPGESVMVEGFPDLQKTNGINNFQVFLDNYANGLAGKSHPLDRWISDTIPGGRKTLQVMDWVNNRMKANTILGNMGSAFAQIANVPLGIASAKQYSVRGMKRVVAGIMEKRLNPDAKLPIDKSIFLKERYMQSPKDRFPFSFSDKPGQATVEEGRKRLAWILQTADRIGTEFIWNSHYEQYIGRNRRFEAGKEIWKDGASLDEAVRFADGKTRDLIAGRGIGEVPLGQKSRAFQFVAPFTLEVGNFWWAARDFLKEKDMPAIATLVLANYLFNEAAERTRGSRVVYDPINAFIDGTEQLWNESKEGRYGVGLSKFLGRNAGEIASNIPLGQSLATALLPEDWRRDYLGSQDPGRFGAGPIPASLTRKIIDTIAAANEGTLTAGQAVSDMVKLALQVVLPYGGKQIEKTWEGLQAVLGGEVKSGTGKQNFTVSQSPINFVKAILFGQYATSEARNFFDEREDLFDRLNRQESDRKRISLHAESDWKKMQNWIANGENEKAASYLEKVAGEEPDRAKKIAEIAADEKLGLSGVDRMVKMLGVANGERAKYIVSEMRSMNGEEKAAFIEDLATKKLLPKEVIAQITFMLQQ